MPLVNRGHPAAVALALIGQPLPLARTGHPLSFRRGHVGLALNMGQLGA